MPLDSKTIEALKGVTTATLTTVLLKKGLRNVWLRGAKPLRPGQPRIVGPAFTLRFVPAREDLATPASWSSPTSTRAAIEAMPAGCIAVVDAMGVTDAGIFGDILCERIRVRKSPASSPTASFATSPESSAPICPSGAKASPRHPPSPASPSSPGSAHRLRRRSHLPGRHRRRRRRRRRSHPRRPPRRSRRRRRRAGKARSLDRRRSPAPALPLPGLYPPNAETKARYQAFRNSQTKAADSLHTPRHSFIVQLSCHPERSLSQSHRERRSRRTCYSVSRAEIARPFRAINYTSFVQGSEILYPPTIRALAASDPLYRKIAIRICPSSSWLHHRLHRPRQRQLRQAADAHRPQVHR
jgi:hypothetical protein